MLIEWTHRALYEQNTQNFFPCCKDKKAKVNFFFANADYSLMDISAALIFTIMSKKYG